MEVLNVLMSIVRHAGSPHLVAFMPTDATQARNAPRMAIATILLVLFVCHQPEVLDIDTSPVSAPVIQHLVSGHRAVSELPSDNMRSD
jgi:hypothetical protein